MRFCSLVLPLPLLELSSLRFFYQLKSMVVKKNAHKSYSSTYFVLSCLKSKSTKSILSFVIQKFSNFKALSPYHHHHHHHHFHFKFEEAMESSYKTLEIIRNNTNSSVFHLILNRPSHLNALSLDSFIELPKALSSLDQNPDVSVIILSGAGKHFCSGIDLTSLSSISQQSSSDDKGRSSEQLRRKIKSMQAAITAIEQCRKPVIAAIHGACIGGGVDVITACDIRYCSEDAFFSIKEVDLAIVADLGTLQRLPSIVGYANAMELALTARRFSGREAKDLGLVSQVFGSKLELDHGVTMIAEGN